MAKVTIKTNKDIAQNLGSTTVSGGGYIKMSAQDYAKYKNMPAAGEMTEKTAVPEKLETNTSQMSGSVVAARDYVSGKGYSGIVDWDGENVLIGGQAVTPSYIKDGTAYIPKAAADAIINKLEENNGIKSAEAIDKSIDKKYGKALKDAINALTSRKEFTYDPEKDPVFAAYRNMYEREADSAYRRVLNDNNTSVTGASGAVLSEAIAARSGEMKKLTDMIPELAGEAYKRYVGEGERLTDEFTAIAKLAADEYSRRYNASRNAYNDIIKAGKAERSEKGRLAELDMTREQNRIRNERNAQKDAYEKERNAQKDAYEKERNAQNDAYKNALNQIAIEKAGIELKYYPYTIESSLRADSYKTEATALDNALARGFYIASDEAALPWLKDYRTDDGYSISPLLTRAAYAYQNEYNKKKANIAAIMGW